MRNFKFSENVTNGETNRGQARRRNQALRKTGLLYKLDPVKPDGLIHVGGRIRREDIPVDLKHPVIILPREHLTEVLIEHHHLKENHMGCGVMHKKMRQSGYWLINGSSSQWRSLYQIV